MHPEAYQYAKWIWMAVGAIWLAASLNLKRTKRREPVMARLFHIAVVAAAVILVASDALRIGPLAWRFVPDWPILAWTGVALTAAGCAFSVWARLLLGGNWSSSVTIKQDHQLIRRGPYTIVRHPIYSGFLLALWGTSLALGELRGIVALTLAFIGWRIKSLKEEAFLIAQFGTEYVEYEHEVKALIPFVL